MPDRKMENITCQACKARQDSLFNFCTAAELEHLSGVKYCQSYKKGQTIFYEDHRTSGLYCLNYGKVKLTKLGSEGKEKIIRLAGPGDWIGYKALITNDPLTASAVALEDTSVCFIPASDFFHVLNTNNEFQTKFTQLVCRTLTNAEDEIVDIAYKSVKERLAEALLLLKRKYEVEPADDTDVVLSITREDLANLIGTAKETVIRLLSDFKSEGIIESQGRKIVLKDQPALTRISQLND